LCFALSGVNYTNYIPGAVRSNPQVCGRLTDGIADANPAEGMEVPLFLVVCCVGSGLCNRLITRSEESYRVRVSNCVWSGNLNNEVAYARFGLLRHSYTHTHTRARARARAHI
jgi:hypothetical protein